MELSLFRHQSNTYDVFSDCLLFAEHPGPHAQGSFASLSGNTLSDAGRFTVIVSLRAP